MPPEQQDNRVRGSLSTNFTVHDIIVSLIAIVAVASAFFMYDTRITVLETKQQSDHTVCQVCQDRVQSIEPRLITVERGLEYLQRLFDDRGNKNLPVLQELRVKAKELEVEVRDIRRQLKN